VYKIMLRKYAKCWKKWKSAYKVEKVWERVQNVEKVHTMLRKYVVS